MLGTVQDEGVERVAMRDMRAAEDEDVDVGWREMNASEGRVVKWRVLKADEELELVQRDQ